MSIEIIGGSFTLDRTGLFTQTDRYAFPSQNGALPTEAENFASAYEESNFSVDESGAFWVGEYRSTDAQGMITEELDFSMHEEPIQSHPNFFTPETGIAAVYQYDPVTNSFAKTKPDGSPNPLYGCTSYLAMTATFRKNQSVGNLASISGLFDNIGKISGPTYELVAIPVIAWRNWLKLTPKIVSRSGVFEVSESWMLSGAGGWNSNIYV
jgi:hypothetical protein